MTGDEKLNIIFHTSNIIVTLKTLKTAVTDQPERDQYNACIKHLRMAIEGVKLQVFYDHISANETDVLNIPAGGTGHDFASILGPGLNDDVTEILVQDAYIKDVHQSGLFAELVSTLVKKCTKLKLIHVCTTDDSVVWAKQGLSNKQLTIVQFSRHDQADIHDRWIAFNNLHKVGLRRGLDFL